MANTYTQIHIKAVFAVKLRPAVIISAWKEELQKYITGIVQNHSHKMLCKNSMPDQLHLPFGFRPSQSLADLMRMVKGESSEWINTQKFTPSIFRSTSLSLVPCKGEMPVTKISALLLIGLAGHHPWSEGA